MTPRLPVSSYAVCAARVDLPPHRVVALPPPGPHPRKARLPELALALARAALGATDAPDDASVILASALGSQTETFHFLEEMIRQREAHPRPRAFSSSVHNAAAARVAIQLGARGESATFVHGDVAFAHALTAARLAASRGGRRWVLAGLDEVIPWVERVRAVRTPDRDPHAEGGALLWCDLDAPPLAWIDLVRWGRPLHPTTWLHPFLAHHDGTVWSAGLELGDDYRVWTGDHPSALASAVALGAAWLSGDLHTDLGPPPPALAILTHSPWGDTSALRLCAP